jgi:hypothetical protein
MSDTLTRIIKQLKNGELPPELNFTNKEQEEIDWSKVQYNAFYKSPSFFESKFPEGLADNLPGFDKVIESMACNAQSPLEEMLQRIEESKERQANIKEEE